MTWRMPASRSKSLRSFTASCTASSFSPLPRLTRPVTTSVYRPRLRAPLRQQSAVAEAGDLPACDSISRDHGWQNQVDHVGFGGAEAPGRGNHRDIVFVAEQEQVA